MSLSPAAEHIVPEATVATVLKVIFFLYSHDPLLLSFSCPHSESERPRAGKPGALKHNTANHTGYSTLYGTETLLKGHRGTRRLPT